MNNLEQKRRIKALKKKIQKAESEKLGFQEEIKETEIKTKTLYDSVQDFKVDYIKTTDAIKKMKSNNSLIESNRKKILTRENTIKNTLEDIARIE